MEEINGKTLKEWKLYCKDDSVPIKTMKYILCLEERVKQLAIPVVSRSMGNDTKPTLRIMTPEQKENYSVPCHLCKYKNSDYESKECQKCIEDDISDQYYY